MISHVVLTRFNIATPGREAEIRNQEGWLAGRFELFERYCLPSMAAQVSDKFRWLVFFDKSTPAAYVERIERCRQVAPFEPIYTGLFPASGWEKAVRAVLPDGTRHLITTRLDNDDAIGESFLEDVRNEAERLISNGISVPVALNWTRGLVIANGAVYAQKHPSNAFISLVECGEHPLRTAMGIQHMEMPTVCRVYQLGDRPGWLQVVHGGNVSNKIRGWRTTAQAAGAVFGFLGDLGLGRASLWHLWLENLTLFPVREMRDGLSRIVRSIRRSIL